MISHSQQDLDIEWFIGCAEKIPLRTGSIDAVVSTLALPLSYDLTCGRWEELYGDVLHIDKIDAGYYFIFAK